MIEENTSMIKSNHPTRIFNPEFPSKKLHSKNYQLNAANQIAITQNATSLPALAQQKQKTIKNKSRLERQSLGQSPSVSCPAAPDLGPTGSRDFIPLENSPASRVEARVWLKTKGFGFVTLWFFCLRLFPKILVISIANVVFFE